VKLHWVAFLLAAQFSLPGCASYQGKPAPMPMPKNMPYSYSDDEMAIYADPYVQLGRQREYFDAELSKMGVIPIQLLIQNKSDGPLPCTAISLELPDGAQIPRSHLDDFMRERSLSQDELRKLKAPPKEEEPRTEPSEAARMAGELGKAALEGAVVGAIQGALPLIIISSPVWGPIVYAVYRSKQAWLGRLSDYHDKELESYIVLNKGGSTQGFIFFVVPPDVDLSGAANLVFSFVGGPIAMVKLYLKDFGSRAETPISTQTREQSDDSADISSSVN
jgi:hypothetical protein